MAGKTLDGCQIKIYEPPECPTKSAFEVFPIESGTPKCITPEFCGDQARSIFVYCDGQ